MSRNPPSQTTKPIQSLDTASDEGTGTGTWGVDGAAGTGPTCLFATAMIDASKMDRGRGRASGMPYGGVACNTPCRGGEWGTGAADHRRESASDLPGPGPDAVVHAG